MKKKKISDQKKSLIRSSTGNVVVRLIIRGFLGSKNSNFAFVLNGQNWDFNKQFKNRLKNYFIQKKNVGIKDLG